MARTGNTHGRSSKVTETGRGSESRHTHFIQEEEEAGYTWPTASIFLAHFRFLFLPLFSLSSFSFLPHRLFRPLTCSISTCPVVFYFCVSFIPVSSFSWPQRHQFARGKKGGKVKMFSVRITEVVFTIVRLQLILRFSLSLFSSLPRVLFLPFIRESLFSPSLFFLVSFCLTFVYVTVSFSLRHLHETHSSSGLTLSSILFFFSFSSLFFLSLSL